MIFFASYHWCNECSSPAISEHLKCQVQGLCGDCEPSVSATEHATFGLLCVMFRLYLLGYHTGEFQALQLIVAAVFGAVD